MNDQTVFVVPDPVGRPRASDYLRRYMNTAVPVPANGQRSERVAKVLLRLTGRSGMLPAGLKADGKPDDRYTRVVVNSLFRASNPFSAASSRDQTPADTPRDVVDQPIEIIEDQQVVHEEIFSIPQDPEPEPEPAPVPAPNPDPDMMSEAPPKSKGGKRGSRAAESTH